MVTINILIEGGLGENDPQLNNPKMLNNHNTLRMAFTKLFERIVGQRVKPNIIPLGPIGNQRNVISDVHDFYWRDLDTTSSEKAAVRQNLLNIIPLLSDNQIYFFVQEVEAWILSQLDMLELPLYIINPGILQHSTLRRYNHPENIPNPADKLITVAHIFISEKGKPSERFRYGKLKNAYHFIQALNVIQLKQDFEDVRLFSSLFEPPQTH